MSGERKRRAYAPSTIALWKLFLALGDRYRVGASHQRLRRFQQDQECREMCAPSPSFPLPVYSLPRTGAKRIGLLFSKAEIDWTLDPKVTEDIEDIIDNGENFSDGCGLIGPNFARLLSRRKKLMFHGRPYTPCVFQIRYAHNCYTYCAPSNRPGPGIRGTKCVRVLYRDHELSSF